MTRLVVVVVDELASLTAYVTDRDAKTRIKAALSLLLSQGRAVGVVVVAALQDPRKDVLPFRDLFPTRIAMRLTEPEQVDMTLGEGARRRGAACDKIPEHLPGIGYVVLDGVAEPIRVRFPLHHRRPHHHHGRPRHPRRPRQPDWGARSGQGRGAGRGMNRPRSSLA